jgi:uncharacterized Zn-binding protein involved in type VI secretion
MPEVVRLGDPGTTVHPSCTSPVPITSYTAQGQLVNSGGREVYANSILISTDTDLNSPHGPHGGSGCAPAPTPYATSDVSQTVFIGGKGVARIEDPYTCTAKITSGSPDVFVGR